MYILPEEVKDFHRDLSKLSDDTLYSRFNFELMETHNVYPNIWDNEAEKTAIWNYILQGIAQIRTLYKQASENDEAIITYIV